jgi:glutamate--cysteine ligase
MRFVEAFLIYCLLQESPPFDEALWAECARNHTATATRGRDPDFRLHDQGRERSLGDWAGEILRDVRPVAELIDRAGGGNDYAQAIDSSVELLANPDATPSARILAELQQNDTAFYHFAMASARGHREYFEALEPLSDERLAIYQNEVSNSVALQQEIEESDSLSFEEYLASYYSQDSCP